MLAFQEKVVNAAMHKGDEQVLEMIIQVAESANMINRIVCKGSEEYTDTRDMKI